MNSISTILKMSSAFSAVDYLPVKYNNQYNMAIPAGTGTRRDAINRYKAWSMPIQAPGTVYTAGTTAGRGL